LHQSLVNQVEDFAARVESKVIVFDPAYTLLFLAGGLNDRRLPSAETVDNLKGHVRRLYGLGGRHFRIALLPAAIPAFSEVGLRLNPELDENSGRDRSRAARSTAQSVLDRASSAHVPVAPFHRMTE
jgi:hypothetical protein